jgi:NADH-quinone oxidoreductase subunit G
MAHIAQDVPVFEDINYQKLAQVEEQWPIIGREDLYYGGTTYANKQGLGVQLPLVPDGDVAWPQASEYKLPKLGLIAFPVTRLYDQGTTLKPSALLRERIGETCVILNAEDGARLKVQDGAYVRLVFSQHGGQMVVPARLDASLPERVALIPRSFGVPISGPCPVEVRLAERLKA